MRKCPKANAERRRALKQTTARKLRESESDAERKMWSFLRRKQMAGLRFRRQQPIGPYIVDFFCASMKLIVELDGGQHAEDSALAYDRARTRWFYAQGYRVLRFWNIDFQENPDAALEGVWRAILENGRPLPGSLRSPTLPQGEG